MLLASPRREILPFGALALAAAAAGLGSCAEKTAPQAPAPKAETAMLSSTMGVYTDVDIHCVDGREVDSLLGLKLPPGPHKVVVSYSVCGVDRNCVGYMGEIGFTAAAGRGYRVEGKLPLNATAAQFTVVNAKDGKPVAGPYSGERNVLAEDPKQHYRCAPKAAG